MPRATNRLRFLHVPTDWLLYEMTRPTGLVLIGLAIAIPFLFWRLVLGDAFAAVGFTPLVVAYACAALGLLVGNFWSSYDDFSHRVSIGVLQEAKRWSIVPGWTVYGWVISLIFALPLVAIVGAPLSGLLLRMQRLTYASIAVTASALWLGLALIGWTVGLLSGGVSAHRPDSFTEWLIGLLPGIVFGPVAFLVGIRLPLRSVRRA